MNREVICVGSSVICRQNGEREIWSEWIGDGVSWLGKPADDMLAEDQRDFVAEHCQATCSMKRGIAGAPRCWRQIVLFLIDYDRQRGQIVELRRFDSSSRLEAENSRLQLELSLNRSGIVREVVLLEAATEAALRRTHRRYFESLAELATMREGGCD